MTPNRWLKSQKRAASTLVRLGILFHLTHALTAIAQAWLLAYLLYELIFVAPTDPITPSWFLLLVLLFTLKAGLSWLAERCSTAASAKIRHKLRTELYEHLNTLGPTYMSGQTSGSLLEILLKGIDDLHGYYAKFFPVMITVMVIPLAILLVLAPIDWVSALLLFLSLPLIPVAMIVIGKKAAHKNEVLWERLTRMGAHFLDAIQGLTTLKIFSASRREIALIAKISNDYRLTTMQVLRLAFLSSAVLELFATAGIALVAIFVGLRLYGAVLPLPSWISLPQPSLLHALFIVLLVPEFYQPLRNFSIQYHTRMHAAAAAEQMIRILDTSTHQQPSTSLSCMSVTAPITIEFKSVTFAYESDQKVLDQFNLSLPANQHIALIGASGAGKSTVLSLLLKFATPQSGRILINGTDLQQLSTDAWFRLLTWIPQEPRLFQGTIAENISLGLEQVSAANIQDAAERAYAHDFISQLPGGYQYRVGERGAGLSGGQIQRIALARAFLRNTPLLLLDEPTASLDEESERAIQQALATLTQGRTVLSIAHRLATVTQVDQICVMQHGRIVESGTHEALIANQGIYPAMLNAMNPNQALHHSSVQEG